MNRLTERFSNGQAAVYGCGENCKYDFKYCKTYNENCPTMVELYEKLAAYEDLEEQGLLVKLPCRVGDVLFNIENGEIESFVVEEFRISTYKIDRVEIYFENRSGFGLCLFDGTLDEGYFLTLEEAEAALTD